jgi:hypothetical protein
MTGTNRTELSKETKLIGEEALSRPLCLVGHFRDFIVQQRHRRATDDAALWASLEAVLSKQNKRPETHAVDNTRKITDTQ